MCGIRFRCLISSEPSMPSLYQIEEKAWLKVGPPTRKRRTKQCRRPAEWVMFTHAWEPSILIIRRRNDRVISTKEENSPYFPTCNLNKKLTDVFAAGISVANLKLSGTKQNRVLQMSLTPCQNIYGLWGQHGSLVLSPGFCATLGPIHMMRTAVCLNKSLQGW